MPTGRVKWFDAEKGFGFVSADDGEQVFLHASALPQGLATVQQGQKLEFDIVDGRKGVQVLKARLVDAPPTPTRTRRDAEQMAGMIEDLITLLDAQGNQLRRGRYPEPAAGRKTAELLRAVADDLDA